MEEERAANRRRRSNQIARRAGRRVADDDIDRLDPSEEALRVRRMKNRLQYKNSQLKKQQLQNEVAAMAQRSPVQNADTSSPPKQYPHEYRMRRGAGPRADAAEGRLTEQQQRQAKFEQLKSLIQKANKETVDSIERDFAAQSAFEQSATTKRALSAMQIRPLTDSDLEWMRAYSDNGRPYFYNIRTGESKWRRPDEAARQQAQQQAVDTLRSNMTPAGNMSLAEQHGLTMPRTGQRELTPMPTQSQGKKSATDPNRALYSQLLSTLLWYRGSVGNDMDASNAAGTAGAGWFYLDKVSQVHGPFEPSMMRAWLRGGFFNSKLPVRYGLPATSEEDQQRLLHQFLPIECYFPKGVEPFPPVNRAAMVRALRGVRQKLMQGTSRQLGPQL